MLLPTFSAVVMAAAVASATVPTTPNDVSPLFFLSSTALYVPPNPSHLILT